MDDERKPISDLLDEAGTLPSESGHDNVERWLTNLREIVHAEPPERRRLAADAARNRLDEVKAINRPAELLEQYLSYRSNNGTHADQSVEPEQVAPEVATRAQALLRGEPDPLTEGLAENDDTLLGAAYETMTDRGLVGEKKNAKTLFLAGVGGCLGDPIHASLHGDSSSGKNEITRRVLELFPEEMVHKLTGMSTHAMEYRGGRIAGVVVIQEVHGQEDAQYQLREAMSEGRLTRWTVDEGEDGMEARELEVEIDASIITTTTKPSLHPENATRVFTLEADSSAEQTRNVLDEVGKRAERPDERVKAEEDDELQVWRELIRHLEPQGVIVPFGTELSAAIPERTPRARRDAKRVLALIRASALFHQYQRETTDEGYLVASLDDYRAVYPLLDTVLEPTISGLTDTARELIDLHNELAEDSSGGWVKRADLEDEAGQRSIASPNTVRRWAKELSREGVWEGEQRKHNAWWHRQANDPESGAVNLPEPDELEEGVTKGTNTPQTGGGKRKARHDGENGEVTKVTNDEEGREGTPSPGPSVGNPGNDGDDHGVHGDEDLPPPDWDPLGTVGNPSEDDADNTCRNCGSGGTGDDGLCTFCRREREAT